MQFDINQILEKACQNITCPLCGKLHQKKEVKLRGFFDEVYIFQTQCAKNHPLLTSIFIATLNSDAKIDTRKKLIDTIHKQINEFDGDFSKLWKQ